jgi:hypothetical protein
VRILRAKPIEGEIISIVIPKGQRFAVVKESTGSTHHAFFNELERIA